MTVRIEKPEKLVKIETFVKGLIATGMSADSIKNQVLDKFCDDIEEKFALIDWVEKILMTSCDLERPFAMMVKPEDSINRYYADGESHYRRLHVGYVVNGKFWKLADVGNVTFAEELCDKQHRERNKDFHSPVIEPLKSAFEICDDLTMRDMRKAHGLPTFEFYFTSGRELLPAEHNRLQGMNVKKLKCDITTNDHVYGIDMESVWDLGRLVKATGKSVVMTTNLRLEIIDDYRE